MRSPHRFQIESLERREALTTVLLVFPPTEEVAVAARAEVPPRAEKGVVRAADAAEPVEVLFID